MALNFAQLGSVLTAHAWSGDCTQARPRSRGSPAQERGWQLRRVVLSRARQRVPCAATRAACAALWATHTRARRVHTQLAVCPNSVEIHVYSTVPVGEPTRWERRAVLREHDQPVCGLDWAPRSGKLLSCSHDRNIYVWSPPAPGRDSWAPALVVHHLSRAALCAAWAPSERKFAVGSGAGAVAVCYYEAENDWWVGKLVKKHHSASVLCVAWHPVAPLLATACADGKARVLAAHVRGADEAGAPGAALRFGEALLVCEPGAGWVHGIAWAPAGDALAFVTHAGGVHFVTRLDAERAGDWGTAAPPVAQPPLPLAGRLPSLAVVFLSDSLAVAAGFDGTPLLLARTARGWAAAGEIVDAAPTVAAAADKKSEVRLVKLCHDEAQRSAGAPCRGRRAQHLTMWRARTPSQSQFSARLASFKSQTERGESGEGGSSADDAGASGAPRGVHQNTVTCVRCLPKASSGAAFSTSGVDGRLAVWAADSPLAARLGNLTIV